MENLAGKSVVTHRWLICDKKKNKSKQWSEICEKRLQCGWLRVDSDGLVHCDFLPVSQKRVEQHKRKLEQSRSDK